MICPGLGRDALDTDECRMRLAVLRVCAAWGAPCPRLSINASASVRAARSKASELFLPCARLPSTAAPLPPRLLLRLLHHPPIPTTAPWTLLFRCNPNSSRSWRRV
ncbi:unnamed protein product [Pleuronectes platessa]|uniref:Uncharacterized protein n=1 Tax=Pleuronectes platessa TaxID=8262 RepID=A0A9N7TTY0_PLEPL|nr:unnamed protein product [Pleuronectes platessa]